jgi:hypothetical protein
MSRLARRSIFALCCLVAVSSPGCALVDLIDGDPVATVRFFATHAGTEGQEGYPDYGDEETTRVFTTEDGWQIALSETYVTTAEVHFVRCEESAGTSIEMFWGPCPESFVSTNDLESVPLGAVTVTDGLYCGIDVTFGPFVPPEGGDEHIAVGNTMIQDNTIVIVGVARRGEGAALEEVPFEIVSDAVITASLDISKLEQGKPLKLEDENFPRDLTIVKTYDRFFDGIDFATATPAELETAVLAALEFDTQVHDGTFD